MAMRAWGVGGALAAILVLAGPAGAWGPHPKITQAALAVVPEMPRWQAALGEQNIRDLAKYCWLPDQRGLDLGDYYADDYLLMRALPRHVDHVMPAVRQTFEPCFRRAVQALRTETPVNACRQIGPILHFVEDAGAPPHAKERCPHHSELENWVREEQIAIAGYKPQLLGTTEDEAVAGLLKRMDGLVAFSRARAERALPLVSAAKPNRAQVEPIILESALESARVTADLLYTLFTVGLAPAEPEGARLTGTVKAAALPLGSGHGARVVLLDTGFMTLATTAAGRDRGEGWIGEYSFRKLPAGTYRVLVYRTGSRLREAGLVTLRAGEEARLDVGLEATEPAGNILENPDGRLSYLEKGAPDRWRVVPAAAGEKPAAGVRTWASAAARVEPGRTYRVGAVLADPEATVTFLFQPRPGTKGAKAEPVRVTLLAGQARPPEVRLTADKTRAAVEVRVTSPKPLVEAIERVWIVPVEK